jgi:hypothetical protein
MNIKYFENTKFKPIFKGASKTIFLNHFTGVFLQENTQKVRQVLKRLLRRQHFLRESYVMVDVQSLY